MASSGAAGSGGAGIEGQQGSPRALSNRQLHALIDTNVVLDLLLQREPWYAEAQPMWEARDQGRLFGYVAASVLTDIFYICRKQVGIDRARHAVEVCLTGFTVVTVDRALLEHALVPIGIDIEDNVQIVCAQTAQLYLIITRNVTAFRDAPIPAVTPTELPARLTP